MATIRFPFDHSTIQTAQEFRDKTAQAGYDIPVSGDLSPLRRSVSLRGKTLPNAMAIQPLEGLDAYEDGTPSSLTHARYEKLAAQGAGILWVEATAICPEGRDSLQQLWIHPGSLEGFRQLVKTIDAAAAGGGYGAPYKVLQLTHSGRHSVDGAGHPAPMAAFHSPYLDPVLGDPLIVTDAYLDELQITMGRAAALAAQAGFDAVELKLCHQYLFNELLCAYTRPGKYGGSRQNRFRFALGALEEMQRQTGGQVDIVVRLNVYDAIPWPYGWGMTPAAGAGVCSQTGDARACSPAASARACSPATGAGICLQTAESQVCGQASAGASGIHPAPGVVSSWQGNGAFGQISEHEKSNWCGNTSPLQISDHQRSNWQGNPKTQPSLEAQRSNWQGNRTFEGISSEEKSNWSGNPAPFHISTEQKSSWQGNPQLQDIAGSAATNWAGNPQLQDIAGSTATNWPGNPVLSGNPGGRVGDELAGSPADSLGATYSDNLGSGCIDSSGDNVHRCAEVEVQQDHFDVTAGPMQADPAEVLDLMRCLYDRGIRIFNLTTTSPRFAPEGNGFMDNFDAKASVDPYGGVAALLQATRQLRAAMPADARIVGTGLSWFGPCSANVAAGGLQEGWFDIAGFGRSVMSDDGFIPSILRGEQPDPAKACIGCDSCFKLFYRNLPTGCPIQHQAYRDLL